MNQEMDAMYILSAQTHIVDCLMADIERRRYRRSYVIWTSRKSSEVEEEYAPKFRYLLRAVLPPEQRLRLDQSQLAREQIVLLRVLNIDFYPRESHLITFRDPWSFPTLFHPACNQLVRKHMDDLAQKVCPC